MSADDPKILDLRQAAADEAAGDLTPEEQVAFTALAKSDPELSRECAFWRTLHGRLSPKEPDPTWSPGRSFSAGIMNRLEAEREQRQGTRAVVIPLPRWIAAGLAACIGVVIGYVAFGRTPSAGPILAEGPTEMPAGEVIGYQDDGGTLVSPEVQHVRWASYMPLTHLSEIETTQAHGPSSSSATPMKPWLGVWTKPIELETHGVKGGHGHLVLRVANGSPAYTAGLRPGDVLLSIDGCPVVTPHCIADHMVKAKPGDDVSVKFWSAQTASISEVTVTLGCLCE